MIIKKMIKDRGIWNIFLVLTVLIGLSSFVSAQFGVGSPVRENLYPGQVLDSSISLQNTIDDAADIVVSGEILKGGEYVSFLKDVSSIEVPASGVVSIPIRISVSENANIGDIYEVELMFRTVSGGAEGEGMIQFRSNVGKSFTIGVIAEPGSEQIQTTSKSVENKTGVSTVIIVWFLVIAVLVILIILWFVSRKKVSGRSS
jgi:hypothetical protein